MKYFIKCLWVFLGGEGRLGKRKQTNPPVYSTPFSPIHSENTTKQHPTFSTVEKNPKTRLGYLQVTDITELPTRTQSGFMGIVCSWHRLVTD